MAAARAPGRATERTFKEQGAQLATWPFHRESRPPRRNFESFASRAAWDDSFTAASLERVPTTCDIYFSRLFAERAQNDGVMHCATKILGIFANCVNKSAN
jgi:hypothetical protein